jgi:hypothetical protein
MRALLGQHSWSRSVIGSSRRQRPRAARGQALVETALFFTILVLLVAGATDISSLLNDHLNLVYAARAGARTGSILGNQTVSDCAAIGAIQAALTGEPNLTVTQITIYKAGADGLPSGTTKNVYAGNAKCITSNGTSSIQPAALSTGWPPSARSNQPFYEDSLGVQIDYTYTFQFQLLGSGTFSSSDRAIMPIEVVGIASPVPTPTPIKK